MNKSWEIDINDFEIVNKGGIKGRIEVIVKKVIWKLMKFYTYRMFSQQREFNIQVVTALSGMLDRINAIESRLDNKIKNRQHVFRYNQTDNKTQRPSLVS